MPVFECMIGVNYYMIANQIFQQKILKFYENGFH